MRNSTIDTSPICSCCGDHDGEVSGGGDAGDDDHVDGYHLWSQPRPGSQGWQSLDGSEPPAEGEQGRREELLLRLGKHVSRI